MPDIIATGRGRRRSNRSPRGQALVELALVLPIILVLLTTAIDLGRLFTGWVGLNNAARIAANYAASVPNGPFIAGSTYDTTVRNDTTTINCSLPSVPAPVFTPDNSVGSQAKVGLSCNFRFLTPILGAILGSQITLSSQSIFTVSSGPIPGVPVPPPPPCVAPNISVPNLVGLTMTAARSAWTAAGFTGSFSPNGSNTKVVTGQIPDVGACRPSTQTVVVTHT